MRSCFVVFVAVCSAFVFVSSEAEACSYAIDPEPASQPKLVLGNGDGEPVPTNTQLWFFLDISEAEPDEFTLLDANQQEIAMDSEVLTVISPRETVGHVPYLVFTPKETLAPNSDYVLRTPFGTASRPWEFDFTTSGGPLTEPLEPIELELFRLDGFVPGRPRDDCGGYRPDYVRHYFMRVPRPAGSGSAYYEFEYHFPGDIERSYRFARSAPATESTWVVRDQKYSDEIEPTCVTINKRDFLGRSVSATSCDWTCFAYRSRYRQYFDEDLLDVFTSCGDISPEDADMGTAVDMGDQFGDMGTVSEDMSADQDAVPPEPDDDMDEEDSATCSSVGGRGAPETPLALLGAVCLVALRRRNHGGCDA